MVSKTAVSGYALVLLALCGPCAPAQSAVELQIDTQQVVHKIDRKVYGQFLEHIYHSCNGGLWGDLVWNRSFEQNQSGQWEVQDGILRQLGAGTNQRLVFGQSDWSDYELTMQARKDGGQEGFLILFRVADSEEDAFYWCNFGGWANSRTALERGIGDGNRWGVVGPSAPVAIETGRWYDIRVRCEGAHFKVWLDGELVIDFEDDENALLRGAAGVGSWATQVSYRNLKVASLDGEPLFEGVPEKTPNSDPGTHWVTIGEPSVSLVRGDGANGDYALKLEGKGDGSGVAQQNFNIEENVIYTGSLWAKAEQPAELLLRMKGSEQSDSTLEVKLDVPAGDWMEIPFQFRAGWDCAEAILELVAHDGDVVWIDQVSMMPASWRKEGGFRPDLLHAIAELDPPVIRWPGGCFASAYRWKAGIGPQAEREIYPIEIWDDQDTNSFGTDEFIAMCRKVGAEPLIVVNIGTEQWNGEADREEFMQDVLDWMEYCNGPADSEWGKVRAANGHPEPYNVKYWEIDNETWHMGAEAYADAVRRYAPKMREAFPSVKLAACGSGGMGSGAEEWNAKILEKCADLIDYLSIHHYEDPNRFAEGPQDYEAFFRGTGEQIASSSNPDVKIYVSEWNAQSTDWRTGLYCGGLLNAFERCGDILEIGGPALFLRHQSASAWDNAFINFDQSGWFPAPNYVVMKLWQEHYHPNLLSLEGQTGSLNCSASAEEDGGRMAVKMVNPAGEAVAVMLNVAGERPIRSAALKLVHADELSARNTLGDPDAIKAVPSPIRRIGRTVEYTMPAWSAGVLDIEFAE
jgi:alpha-N-arabinofuranosidase